MEGREIEMKGREISVLGPSKVASGSWMAEQAFLLGGFIAKEEWICVNGGYGGVMEYVSRGAGSAGGKVVGVTIKGIATKNPYLTEAKEMEFFQRLEYLLARPRIFFSPKESKGTLLEFASAMALPDKNIPTIVIVEKNAHWELFDPLRKLWGDQNLMNITDVANSAEEAVRMLFVAFVKQLEQVRLSLECCAEKSSGFF